ncbi:MAG TPA: UDP-N-acetylmuramoyl-L-alanyl-D-glutamate--2,6-diaminopimelate ligase [Rhodocyclaceae bacterium]|nr:UDP-N-acetylmuramoyl-L-alanyl-D-glutamate--2,6-diaminopimelate ligase [Rhodocyclaceae bacterium]
MTRVNDILSGLATQGVTVRSLAADSRQVAAGDVFLAYPGELSDGRAHIDAALAQGAAAVVYEAKDASVHVTSAPNLAVENLRGVVAPLADTVYGHPSRDLWVAGVTGTNGKTSTTQWLAESFARLGKKCALIGTLGNGFPGELVPSPNTTPNALTLQKALRGFLDAGAEACAMEVSSIGIEEGRVDATRFAVAAFTNFTRDHLDYHGSMEAYAEAKLKLFDWPDLRAAVINLDDPFSVRILGRIGGRVPCIGYTLDEAQADVTECLSATNLGMHAGGVSFDVNGVSVRSSVIGRFNASNLLAVMACLRTYGFNLAEAADAVAGLKPPPGRMQVVDPVAGTKDIPLVVVDYAHTPDALEKVLITLREVAQARGGKLYCVFGCGGDRDSGKRPMMGAVAERNADDVIVTSDNPRTEVPDAIIAAIVAGMKKTPRVEVERAVAIRTAIDEATVNDVVLLAGKGHEDYQEVGSVKLPFSDLREAKSALEARAC